MLLNKENGKNYFKIFNGNSQFNKIIIYIIHSSTWYRQPTFRKYRKEAHL